MKIIKKLYNLWNNWCDVEVNIPFGQSFVATNNYTVFIILLILIILMDILIKL